MRKSLRSAEEWREILSRQRDLNQTDTAYAQNCGVSIASLRSWRRKLKDQAPCEGVAKIVEVTPAFPDSPVRVILPNGICIEITQESSPGYVGQLVSLLRSL